MATIYNIDMEIVSEFSSYSELELNKILSELIENYRNNDNGLGLKVTEIRIRKT